MATHGGFNPEQEVEVEVVCPHCKATIKTKVLVNLEPPEPDEP